jgi:hypothetical protein
MLLSVFSQVPLIRPMGTGTMRGVPLSVAILLAAFGSSAAEGQMNEKTLCPVAISVFDGKDLPQMQEFLRFVQNVFDELDAKSREMGEPALKAKLIDMSVEVQLKRFTKRQQAPIAA